MPPKSVQARVLCADSELEFRIDANSLGRHLFDSVVRALKIKEVWYFGLEYIDNKGILSWLKMNRRILGQDVKSEIPLTLKFRVKFFPEDVEMDLIEEITQRYFYLEVRSKILSEEIHCPPETAVLLASYAAQARFGDYTPSIHQKGFLIKGPFLPRHVIDHHTLSEEDWEQRICTWYADHQGLLGVDAILEYLKVAQDLEMYGLAYYEIRNRKGTNLILGVGCRGLKVYEIGNRLSSVINVPWPEIRNISGFKRRISIKPIDATSHQLAFEVSQARTCKQILAVCLGNYELYMRRRKADTLEIHALKARARETRVLRMAEHTSAERSHTRSDMQKKYLARIERYKAKVENEGS